MLGGEGVNLVKVIQGSKSVPLNFSTTGPEVTGPDNFLSTQETIFTLYDWSHMVGQPVPPLLFPKNT